MEIKFDMNASSRHRFEGIDALRGISALLVVWYHAAEQFSSNPSIALRGTGLFDSAYVINAGRIGVIAFFAISGFVVVPTLRGNIKTGTQEFLIKRFFRLYPVFWISVILAYVVVWLPTNQHVTLIQVLANLTMIPQEFKEEPLMGQYWTLEVELIFYGILMVFFICGKLNSQKVVSLSLLFITLGSFILDKNKSTNFIIQHNSITEHLSYFLSVMLWGSLIRDHLKQKEIPNQNGWLSDRWPLMLATFVVFLRPMLASLYGNAHVEEWRAALIGLLLFLICVKLRHVNIKPLTWLGSISYSIYLFHPIVLYPLFGFINNENALAQYDLWLYIAITMTGSIAIAAVTYWLIESPSNKLATNILLRNKVSPIT